MKKNTIKVSGNKYTLNYSPIEIKKLVEDYEEVVQLGDARTIKSYFAEAALSSSELNTDENSFTDLINLFTNKVNQFTRLGLTYVFGVPVKSLILHKGADTVKRTNTKIERDLLNFIIKVNKGKKEVNLEFVPGFILKIKSVRNIDVLFDYRKSIRNY